jgi:hypothetical protein
MAKYLKKSIIVDAVQWFKDGDHPYVIDGKVFNDWGYADVDPGDWIVTYKNGLVECWTPGRFECDFELVKEDNRQPKKTEGIIERTGDEQDWIDWYHNKEEIDGYEF